MGTEKLRNPLIQVIAKTNNPTLLREMGQLAHMGLKDNGVVQLSERQKRELKSAIEEVEAGDFVDHEEAKKQARGWLKD